MAAPPSHYKETERDASTNLPLPSPSCPASSARTRPQTGSKRRTEGAARGSEAAAPFRLEETALSRADLERPTFPCSLCARFGASTRRGAALPPLFHIRPKGAPESPPPHGTPLTRTLAPDEACVNDSSLHGTALGCDGLSSTWCLFPQRSSVRSAFSRACPTAIFGVLRRRGGRGSFPRATSS